MSNKEVPLECSPSLEQVQDPEPLHIKEELEELWTNQEGEQLNDLEEADIIRLPFAVVPVKSEGNEENPQPSQLRQSETEGSREAETPTSSSAKQLITETDGEECGKLEPGRYLDLNVPLQPNTEEKSSDSSETEVSDDDNEWQEPLSDSGCETEDRDKNCKETRAPESGVHVNDEGCNTDKKYFTCFECGKKFNRQTNLKTHMKVHSGEKELVCEVCGKTFNVQSNLKTHMRVHTGEKPFGCDVCGTRFNRQTNLKRHTRIHTGEKQFGCDACGKRFNRQSTLQTHMGVHTGEKYFGCDVCGKRFNVQSNLKTHVRVHTGEKPFGCDVCGKRFNRQSNLKTHNRVHTGENPFHCRVCGKSFSHQGSLKRHLRVHTG